MRPRMEAIEADIATLALDAIVNAANAPLRPGGGVDGAIRRAAGAELDAHLARFGGCPPGTAVITPGYRLPARHVIHTVAPIWNGAADEEAQKETFVSCYASVLKLADENAVATIVFPCIGTGVYGWPTDLAAELACDAVASHLKSGGAQTRIVFCCFAAADRERYAELIAAL